MSTRSNHIHPLVEIYSLLIKIGRETHFIEEERDCGSDKASIELREESARSYREGLRAPQLTLGCNQGNSGEDLRVHRYPRPKGRNEF